MSYKIPLYSKNSEYTRLPEFYDEARGCQVKIKDKWFYDFSVIGASACILGFADKYVNRQVIKCIKNGNFSSLNSRYMAKLTDLLLAIHPYYQTVRYCKGGGEALDLALMLAIEKKNKPVIIQVGYNGWKIKNNVSQYVNFKEINDLMKLISRPDIIVFELIRHEYPDIKVIDKLKEWQKQGTILICDEVTTGFRITLGGCHQLYGLEPDITVYAKGISNGYPLAVVIGKEAIMESDLWISSTYWTDSMGFVAGYYTIKKLKHCNYTLLIKLGQTIKTVWTELAKRYKIKIKTGCVPQIINFEFDYPNKLLLKNLFIEKMQEEGILALDQFYPTFAHDNKAVGTYIKACNKVFKFISENLDRPEHFIKNRIKELKK